MTTILDASNLVLKDVHRLLKLERQLNNSFTSLLSLEPLTETERQDLEKICNNFETYYEEGNFLEGEVKFLLLSPLMWLAGFYHPQIRISLEEGITPINIEDENTIIRGRMDILAVTKTENNPKITLLWVLLIESKRTLVDASEGLPQLLTYAYPSLEHQDSVWGLATNGKNYQFVYLQQGVPSIYQLLPELNIIRPEHSIELLQVLKAICKQYV
jgi:hypothetical protein